MSWDSLFNRLKEDSKFTTLYNNLIELNKEQTIYPPKDLWFNCFQITKYDDVKVVILGQDPYIRANQAHGLSFSVEGDLLPPSLLNIFKELNDDLGCPIPKSGNLTKWGKQGVLLLNTILTVEEGKSLSHQNIGWEYFSKKVIEYLNQKNHLVYILWGNYAHSYIKYIDTTKHIVIKGPHPSPLSAYRGFFGSKPFSRTNEILIKQGMKPIDWCLS